MNRPLLLAPLLSLLAVAGCNSYRVTQTNDFANDDGEIVRVEYGQSDKDHVNTFRSPANGRELEFKSKLVVRVEMPDGEDFTAWQCMNFYGPGTSYKSDDGEWLFVASGFTCRVGRLAKGGKPTYDPVFNGVLCNTPTEKAKKDERWRKVDVPRKKYTAK